MRLSPVSHVIDSIPNEVRLRVEGWCRAYSIFPAVPITSYEAQPPAARDGVMEKKLAELAETLSFWQTAVPFVLLLSPFGEFEVLGSSGKMIYQADAVEPARFSQCLPQFYFPAAA